MITTEIMKTWGWRIRKLGLKDGEFAEIVGVTPQTLSTYINAKQTPLMGRFELIENKLKELEEGV